MNKMIDADHPNRPVEEDMDGEMVALSTRQKTDSDLDDTDSDRDSDPVRESASHGSFSADRVLRSNRDSDR